MMLDHTLVRWDEQKRDFSLFCERKIDANVVTDQQLHIP